MNFLCRSIMNFMGSKGDFYLGFGIVFFLGLGLLGFGFFGLYIFFRSLITYGQHLRLCQNQTYVGRRSWFQSTAWKENWSFSKLQTSWVHLMSLRVELSDRRQKVFNFNRIFDQSSTQQDLFNELDIPSMIGKVLDGYHSTIFAYGQTGSGKTFTIEGPENNPGLIVRSVE